MIEHGTHTCQWCMTKELLKRFGKIFHLKLNLPGKIFVWFWLVSKMDGPLRQVSKVDDPLWTIFTVHFYANFSSHTRRKKTDLQFQIMNIYYTKESPRNKEYDKYPYFKHVVKPQDKLVGYYAMKQDWKYVVLRKV